MKLRLFAFFIVWMFAMNMARAQDSWELRRNENGITIYSQRHDKIVQLRLLTEFNATPASLEAQLQNINNYVNWVYGNKRSGIIKKIND